MHALPIAEAHFGLRRMDIHIDQRRIDIEKQHPGGLQRAMQYVCIGGARRVTDQLVAHETPVHEADLLGARGLRVGGLRDEAAQA